MFKLALSFLLLSSIDFVRLQETSDALTEEALAERVNLFGGHLLMALCYDVAPEHNVLMSPVNTFTALALLHLGSAGNTSDELAAVMEVSDRKNFTEVHEQLKALISKLYSGSEDPLNKFYEIGLANGIFLGNNFQVKDSYLASVQKYYNGQAKNVDFEKNPQQATDFINNWISSGTKGRIAKFYEQSLTHDTSAVLTSALYFNAKWKNTFSAENTKREVFNTGVTEMQIPMMSMNNVTLLYEDNEDLHYESVSLPYSGGEYKMTIYLQHTDHGDHGSLAHLFHRLSHKNFDSSKRVYRLVNLKLPKMKFSWKKSVVQELGLEDIFNAPDLHEMTPASNVKISDMIHAIELEVDEQGTVASATTAIEMLLFSAPVLAQPEPVNFHVNRPYLLTISHELTQTILFAGVIRKPMN